MEQPCRPYRIGDHSRAERNRLLRSMVIAVVLAAAASVAVPIGLALAIPGEAGATAASITAVVLLPLGLMVGHWAIIGRRRWAALELLIWAGRHVTSEFRAATGLRDPTDAAAAARWIAEHPPQADEDVAVMYWRVHLHVLAGDPAAAREELLRLADAPGYEFERAELAGEIDLAEAKPVDLEAIAGAVRRIDDPFRRGVSAVNLGALGAQIAWTCGRDDVEPVLAQRSLVGDLARGTLLRSYWLPFGIVVGASAVILTIVGTIFG